MLFVSTLRNSPCDSARAVFFKQGTKEVYGGQIAKMVVLPLSSERHAARSRPIHLRDMSADLASTLGTGGERVTLKAVFE